MRGAHAPLTLEDLGITRIQSHRWQLESEVPGDKFEGWVAQVKDRGDELTSVALRRLAGEFLFSGVETENQVTSCNLKPLDNFWLICLYKL
jgi:hypothetical protein